MELEVAAVDLLDVRGAPKVFEVNASPALLEMEQATGVDLAASIIARAEVLVAGSSRSRPRAKTDGGAVATSVASSRPSAK